MAVTDMPTGAAGPKAPPAQPTGPLVAADGTPLKRKLLLTQRSQRRRAFGLAAPLLAFITAAFVIPILIFMYRGVHDSEYAGHMPRTAAALDTWEPNLVYRVTGWDATSLPEEWIYAAMVADMRAARANPDRPIGKVATRVNRELSGTRSLFTGTARKARRMEPPFKEAMIAADADWGKVETWSAIKVAQLEWTPAYYAAALDASYTADGQFIAQDEDRQIHMTLFLRTLWIAVIVTAMTLLLGYPIAWLLSNLPLRISNLLLILVLLPFWTSILVRTTAWIAILQGQGVVNDVMIWSDLNDVVLQIRFLGAMLTEAILGQPVWESVLEFAGIDRTYQRMDVASSCANDVNAVLAQGQVALEALRDRTLFRDEVVIINAMLDRWETSDFRFQGFRVPEISVCAPLMVEGYNTASLEPVAQQAAALSASQPNWAGAQELAASFGAARAEGGAAVAEALRAEADRSGYGDERFSMIYNQFGTVVAMTQILLPFMVLPLYSVMKTISPNYVRAAKSLGASNFTAFWRVYFPNTVPGIGAGALLVFILAIGYYITPALVGGDDGQMISNFIDFHMRSSLNWPLAAALGGVLFVFVLFCYWLYDRVIGIDNMKLG